MDTPRLPEHVAIIMDGNGRWAKRQGLKRSAGHKAGANTAHDIVTEARSMGIRHLTLYTFSKENWSRPPSEIGFLFELLGEYLTKNTPSLLEQSIRLNILGDITELPLAARQVITHTCKKTRACSSMVLNLALNYSGRSEILRAVQALCAQGLSPEDITEARFKKFLYTADQPDPDLIIRTSGEFRLSNYLLFQSAYSELYFTDVLWPDFTPKNFRAAIENYATRKRRFGTTGESTE
ncbi:MAG: polyprenyl diphosphate synthase [Desulfoplanes sp.]|nr:polyprenyl diphosphate synthase [Desulfoplanes sp.]